MAIIKRAIKLGTAVGLTYLSVEQRLWSQLTHKEINDKLNAFKEYERNAITLFIEKTSIDSYIKQWIPTKQTLNMDSINVKNVWNRSVKSCFQTISEVNSKDLMKTIKKLMNSTK